MSSTSEDSQLQQSPHTTYDELPHASVTNQEAQTHKNLSSANNKEPSARMSSNRPTTLQDGGTQSNKRQRTAEDETSIASDTSSTDEDCQSIKRQRTLIDGVLSDANQCKKREICDFSPYREEDLTSSSTSSEIDGHSTASLVKRHTSENVNGWAQSYGDDESNCLAELYGASGSGVKRKADELQGDLFSCASDEKIPKREFQSPSDRLLSNTNYSKYEDRGLSAEDMITWNERVDQSSPTEKDGIHESAPAGNKKPRKIRPNPIISGPSRSLRSMGPTYLSRSARKSFLTTQRNMKCSRTNKKPGKRLGSTSRMQHRVPSTRNVRTRYKRKCTTSVNQRKGKSRGKVGARKKKKCKTKPKASIKQRKKTSPRRVAGKSKKPSKRVLKTSKTKRTVKRPRKGTVKRPRKGTVKRPRKGTVKRPRKGTVTSNRVLRSSAESERLCNILEPLIEDELLRDGSESASNFDQARSECSSSHSRTQEEDELSEILFSDHPCLWVELFIEFALISYLWAYIRY